MITVTCTGRLGRDAETKFTPQGLAITETSMAVTEYDFKEKKPITTWIKLTMFGEIFQKKGEYLKSGRLVNVVGSLKVNTFVDKKGETRIDIQIKVLDIQIISIKQEGNDQAQGEKPAYKSATASANNAPKTSGYQSKSSSSGNSGQSRSSSAASMTPMTSVAIPGVPSFPDNNVDFDDIDESDIPF